MLGRAYGVKLSIVDEESDACKDFQEAADLLDKLLRKDVSPYEVCSKDVSTEFLKNLKLRRAPYQSIRWETMDSIHGHD